MHPATAAVYRCAYAVPVLALLAWRERRRYGPRAAGQQRLALIAGLFFAADLIFWHQAIADVGAGLATVLGNLQVVIVPFAAWAVLAEAPGRRILAALPLTLIGVRADLGRARGRRVRRRIRRAACCSARSPASPTPASS